MSKESNIPTFLNDEAMDQEKQKHHKPEEPGVEDVLRLQNAWTNFLLYHIFIVAVAKGFQGILMGNARTSTRRSFKPLNLILRVSFEH